MATVEMTINTMSFKTNQDWRGSRDLMGCEIESISVHMDNYSIVDIPNTGIRVDYMDISRCYT